MKKPPVKSIRHKAEKRVHIPSGEEASYEAASAVVQKKTEAKFPKNPIVHRGHDLAAGARRHGRASPMHLHRSALRHQVWVELADSFEQPCYERWTAG